MSAANILEKVENTMLKSEKTEIIKNPYKMTKTSGPKPTFSRLFLPFLRNSDIFDIVHLDKLLKSVYY